MTLKLHHKSRKFFIQQYVKYDTILQVEHHLLHHFFYPHCQSDFSEHLQITKCIKSSATHKRNIHMTSKVIHFSYFFLPQFVVYIVYKFPLKIYSLQSKAFFGIYHHLFHKTSSSYSNHFKSFSESSLYSILTTTINWSSYDDNNRTAARIYSLNP